jgi:hypothetical protein
MPQEPERPIEKILRDSARERREQAGHSWELHPANRRLLRQEVAANISEGPKGRETGTAKLDQPLLASDDACWSGCAGPAIRGSLARCSATRHPRQLDLLARNEPPPVPALNDKMSSREQESLDEKERSQSSDARKSPEKGRGADSHAQGLPLKRSRPRFRPSS